MIDRSFRRAGKEAAAAAAETDEEADVASQEEVNVAAAGAAAAEQAEAVAPREAPAGGGGADPCSDGPYATGHPAAADPIHSGNSSPSCDRQQNLHRGT